ncbi:MAG TPA: type II secretion system F family protein [Armatimonadota bacterium]|nr:type II secretion system F family protein [Armatimonadota bacterium]
MPSFRYKVKGKSGKTVGGVMVAEDQRSAIERLQKMGYFILDLREEKSREERPEGAKSGFPLLRWFIYPIFAGASPYQLMIFYRQFATMIKSGMSVIHSMSNLRSQGGSRRLKKVASQVLPILESGGKLSDAFAMHPFVFPELHISLIRAGETGGMLDYMLQRIADYLEREHNVRQKLRLATLYPKILVLAVIFIPPLHILLLEGWRPYVRATMGFVIIVGLGLLVLWIVFRLLSQIPAFGYVLDCVKLAIPKLGKTVRMLALAKFYRVLAAMCAAGAPLSQGLNNAAQATGNWYLAMKLKRAVPDIENGKTLTDSLRKTKAVPYIGMDMIQTGEQTGNLDGMLDKAAEYSENEAEVGTVQSTVIAGIFLLLIVAGYIGLTVVRFYMGYYANVMP